MTKMAKKTYKYIAERIEEKIEIFIYYLIILVTIFSLTIIDAQFVDVSFIRTLAVVIIFFTAVGYRLLPVEKTTGYLKYTIEQKRTFMYLFDFIFITLVIYGTGGTESPFVLLFVFPIIGMINYLSFRKIPYFLAFFVLLYYLAGSFSDIPFSWNSYIINTSFILLVFWLARIMRLYQQVVPTEGGTILKKKANVEQYHMERYRFSSQVILIIIAAFGLFLLMITQANDQHDSWWNGSYTYRQKLLTSQNFDVPGGQEDELNAILKFSTQDLINAGWLDLDCRNLKVLRQETDFYVQDITVTGCNTHTTEVSFVTSLRNINRGSYWLYYDSNVGTQGGSRPSRVKEVEEVDEEELEQEERDGLMIISYLQPIVVHAQEADTGSADSNSSNSEVASEPVSNSADPSSESSSQEASSSNGNEDTSISEQDNGNQDNVDEDTPPEVTNDNTVDLPEEDNEDTASDDEQWEDTDEVQEDNAPVEVDSGDIDEIVEQEEDETVDVVEQEDATASDTNEEIDGNTNQEDVQTDEDEDSKEKDKRGSTQNDNEEELNTDKENVQDQEQNDNEIEDSKDSSKKDKSDRYETQDSGVVVVEFSLGEVETYDKYLESLLPADDLLGEDEVPVLDTEGDYNDQLLEEEGEDNVIESEPLDHNAEYICHLKEAFQNDIKDDDVGEQYEIIKVLPDQVSLFNDYDETFFNIDDFNLDGFVSYDDCLSAIDSGKNIVPD